MLRDTAIIEQIGMASSFEEIWQIMLEHFHGEGFKGVAYVVYGPGRFEHTPIFFEDGFPPAMVEAFIRLGYGRDAPTFRMALSGGMPVLAGSLDPHARLSPAEREHRKAMLATGLQEALVLPVFGPRGYSALVILARATSPELFDPVHWDERQIVVQFAHMRGMALAPEDMPASDLSARETEILMLIAQGKSNGVIADILSLSASSVDTYVRRLFDKLNVADRTRAAVKGVSLGIVRA